MPETDYTTERKSLAAEQAKAEQALEARKAEAAKLLKAGKPVPDAVKDDATGLASRIVDLGSKISEIDKAHKQRVDDDAEFFRTLATKTGAITETVETRDADPDDPDGGERRLTRDSVSRFEELIRELAGSKGYRPRVNSESEQIVQEMIAGDPKFRGAKAEQWERRTLELNGMKRTVLAGVNASGGYLVPEDNTFMNQVQMADAAYGGVSRVARTITTQSGAVLPIPNTNANLFIGEAVNENVDVNETDLTFDEDQMHAYMQTSGRLAATFQAVQDAGINLPMLLGMVAGEMLNRREADQFINGTGVNNPQGAVVGYAVNADTTVTLYWERANNAYRAGTTGTNPYVAWFTLFNDLKYAVNPSFRRSPAFTLLLSDDLDRAFSGATVNGTTDQRPLFERWAMGNTARGDGMDFGGLRILSDYSLGGARASSGDGVVADGLIGDFNWFWIRKIAGMFMIEDPYTGAQRMVRRWVFGRRCDSHCLFNTAVTAEAARAANRPARAARSAAIERVPVTSR